MAVSAGKNERRKGMWKQILLLLVLVTGTAGYIFLPFLRGQAFLLFDDVGGDTMTQYYPIYRKLAEDIRNGTFSLYNYSLGLGASWINEQSILMDPFGWITVGAGVVFGARAVKYALTLMTVVKLYAAAFLTYAYLGRAGKRGMGRVAASWLLAFSGYMLLWGQHFFLGTAPVYLLLVLTAAEGALQAPSRKNHLLLALSCGATLLYSTYLGYMILFAAALYYLFRLAWLSRKGEKGTFGKRLWPAVVTVILGCLLGAVLFLPSAEAILATSRIGSGETLWERIRSFLGLYDWPTYRAMLSRFLSNSLMGNSGWPSSAAPDNYYEMPQLFFSSLILTVFLQYLAVRVFGEKEKKARRIKAAAVLAAVLLLTLPIGAGIFNAFADSRFRYTFAFLPLMAWMTADVWDLIFTERKGSLTAGAAGCALSLLGSWMAGRYLDPRLKFLMFAVALFCAAPFGYACLVKLIGLIRSEAGKKAGTVLRKAAPVLLILLLGADLCMEGHICTRWRNMITKDRIAAIAAAEEESMLILGLLEQKYGGEGAVYRVEKEFQDFYYADPMLEDYLPAGGYNSVMTGGIRKLYEELWPGSGHPDNDNVRLFREDPKQEMEDLLGVRFVITAFHEDGVSWPRTEGRSVFENPNATGLIRLYAWAVPESAVEGLSEAERDALIRDTVILSDEETAARYAGGEAANPLSFDPRYLGRDVFEVQTQNDRDSLLVISLPYERSWKLYIDGVRTETQPAFYGLIGAELPAGTHEIRLAYENDLYLIGGCVTLLAAAGLALWLNLMKKGRIPVR